MIARIVGLEQPLPFAASSKYKNTLIDRSNGMPSSPMTDSTMQVVRPTDVTPGYRYQRRSTVLQTRRR